MRWQHEAQILSLPLIKIYLSFAAKRGKSNSFRVIADPFPGARPVFPPFRILIPPMLLRPPLARPFCASGAGFPYSLTTFRVTHIS
jgi:hypothetical protein